ncbi:hypothetical protein A3K34_02230 [candidate division WWE3 bacterium RIFOXYC1_FULL_40_10]|uniref:Uncharacterized protein n=1 Tax=candidate division WWE3 bacterium RIFOXYA2_FULL_46_9 TaxID=1802636 RepID=A0A1F4W1K2_UNCKA|nr:MAG: hypothetical protein A3K58_02230 [candidate division WWE3 bacterium RIFOXYB1_FULL_40_22]OGC61671.1 MAG: hypothetical protein A3K37_02230 [candidate division WWE3 bacterium RIFOXYA1_FULL_40_11]OGC63297.1 MAG: hypothetical protein A2264_02855 [candidate division WWE3 bacterium RIFOXYA2_FULL_46_9]OGC64847.1 MAG: hypothetical protein A2326_01060 [candidate division WWE3 bacterium RIFOXYB2_FULL_41_6]OGC66054.1 MAG: hypothetical protein A3K34_02230 [candidate division WWE3 bacterium RIFOXYC1_
MILPNILNWLFPQLVITERQLFLNSAFLVGCIVLCLGIAVFEKYTRSEPNLGRWVVTALLFTLFGFGGFFLGVLLLLVLLLLGRAQAPVRKRVAVKIDPQ